MPLKSQPRDFEKYCSPSFHPVHAQRPANTAFGEHGELILSTNKHPCEELDGLNESQLVAIENVELAEKFVEILRWIDDRNPVTKRMRPKTIMRKLAVLEAILGMDGQPDTTWTKIADEHGCKRAAISYLAASFQKKFGRIAFGPGRQGMRGNWKGKSVNNSDGSFRGNHKNR